MKFENNSSAQIDFNAKVPHISFPVLSQLPYICHGFSTRLGGVSEGMFSSMNFGVDSNPHQDEKSNILENYKRIAESIGVDPKSFVVSKQVHKTNIRVVDEKDLGKGIYIPADYSEIDGLITNKPGITLVTKYADCVPLYFVDIKKRVIGLTHSGWRGTVMKIGKVTLEAMHEHFGSNPQDVISVIGPSICKDCYEIGEEVAQEFNNAFPDAYKKGILEAKDNGKYQCDLWAANKEVLLEGGMNGDNIHISTVCTCCNSDWMFSHRTTGIQRGSLAAFLALSE